MDTERSLEDFVTDDYLFDLARKVSRNECMEEWSSLLKQYSEKREQMEDVLLLVSRLHLSEVQVSDLQVRQNWNKLHAIIHAHKKRRNLYRLVSVAAACTILAIVCLVFHGNERPVFSTKSDPDLLSMLDRIPQSEKICLTVQGEELYFDAEDIHIVHLKDGSILVNNEKKLELADSKSGYIQLHVPKGMRSSIQLSDGTNLWINSGTKLLFPSNFTSVQRDLYVDGELYLEVAHNKSYPFVVHTHDVNVKVLGTVFNVTAYKEDPYTDVALVSGCVEVHAGDKPLVQLSPNDCYHLEQDEHAVKEVDVYNYISWKDNIMKIDGVSLATIFTRLSRHYNVEIKCLSDYSDVRYVGKLDLSQSIDNVFRNIAVTGSFTYTVENSLITVN